MFPTELQTAVDYLNTLSINVSESHEDGRVNSIDDEDTIIELLAEKFGDNIECPPPRCWWDVKVLVILLISNHQNLEVQRITSHQKQRFYTH